MDTNGYSAMGLGYDDVDITFKMYYESEQLLHVNYRWAKTHPLGQIANLLEAFRPNGPVDYFSLFYG